MAIVRRDTDYAIRCLLHLADAPDRPVACAELAEACAIPPSFAHKVMRKLRDAGFVLSQTGRSGGFRLNRDLRDIALEQVVQVMQGPLIVSHCVAVPDTCPRSPKCPLSAEWHRIQSELDRFLSEKSLHDLLCPSDEPSP